MKLVLPILAMICTVFATLVALVFCMGMGANANHRRSAPCNTGWAGSLYWVLAV